MIEIVCDDGQALFAEVVAPARPRGCAVVGHAMMVDRRTMARLVARLVEKSTAVVWPDLRGHGRSKPLVHHGASWTYDDLVELDTSALVAFARRHFPDLPIAAVGHSLFGHVALAHAARHPDRTFDRLALLAANIWAPRWEPKLRLRLEKRAAIELMALVTRLFGRFPTRTLRLGPVDEAAPYVDDLARFVRDDAWRARDGFDYAAACGLLRVPILSIAADGDRLLCRPESARRFARLVPGAETMVAPGGGHMALVLDERYTPIWDRVAAFVAGA